MSLADTANSIATDFQHIPVMQVIDVRDIQSHDPEVRRKLASQIQDACMRVGFFYVKNHGIEEDVMTRTIDAARKFFALDMDKKMEIENRKSANFKGYSPLLSGNNDPNNAGDLQEAFEFGWEDPDLQESGEIVVDKERDGVMAGANVWPSPGDAPSFRHAAMKYYHAAVNLGKALFPMFALALNLEETYFDDKTRNSAAMMKILHYPPQDRPVEDRVIGIGAHADWECFTILWQESGLPALQVKNSEGEWIDAPPIPGTLVINLGDQFARMTNDVFKSTVHRAINANGAERYSIPLFFGVDYNTRLDPIPGCVSNERPARYEVITGGEYVKYKLQETFAYHK